VVKCSSHGKRVERKFLSVKKRALVTGASGFIGRALCVELLGHGFVARAAIRFPGSLPLTDGFEVWVVGQIDAHTSWASTLIDIDVVIHCAARAHIMDDEALDPLTEYRAVNVQGTLNFASQAAAAGVERFIFLSSVKVNGEKTNGSFRFARDDEPAPEDAYGLSKWEAEQGLWEIASQTGMQVVVVRPPLVYGLGVKGNFARLLKLVHSGVPLPLAAVNNRRSFIGLDNLVDLLIHCVDHPKAAGQTLLVSDNHDLFTPELLRMIANAMERPARLFPVPVSLLRLGGRMFGRLNEVDRLVGSLQVDSSATRSLLDWTPPVSVEEGIRRMVMGTAKS
jgi:nucleoside-diphosphate-sugar epimerase